MREGRAMLPARRGVGGARGATRFDRNQGRYELAYSEEGGRLYRRISAVGVLSFLALSLAFGPPRAEADVPSPSVSAARKLRA
ncbi:hypothetical protein M5K25_006239 [Dendrobium thyrsiflorum]|uniref:Uncharacterized protein n=1 Tax=Dendrobium thyrsiflorum TaxID=117978 RepID=A0ABD0VHV3_DENTH